MFPAASAHIEEQEIVDYVIESLIKYQIASSFHQCKFECAILLARVSLLRETAGNAVGKQRSQTLLCEAPCETVLLQRRRSQILAVAP